MHDVLSALKTSLSRHSCIGPRTKYKKREGGREPTPMRATHTQILERVETTEQTPLPIDGESSRHVGDLARTLFVGSTQLTCYSRRLWFGRNTPHVACTKKAFLNIFYRMCRHASKSWQLTMATTNCLELDYEHNMKARCVTMARRTCVQHRVSAMGGNTLISP